MFLLIAVFINGGFALDFDKEILKKEKEIERLKVQIELGVQALPEKNESSVVKVALISKNSVKK